MNFSRRHVSYLPLFLLSPSLVLCDCYSDSNTKQETQIQPSYNKEARIHVGRDETFYITAGFTYWQPMQENMELGVVGDTSDTLDVIDGSFVNMNFHYKPGFQVGFGTSFLPDDWDVYAGYTWFRGTNHTSKSLDTTNSQKALYPTWQFPDASNPRYFSGKESWTLHMDIVDAELGRSYFVGQKLTVRPFIGLRAPWIRQSVHVTYEDEVHDSSADTIINQSSYAWGIGPRAGMCLDWLLGSGISLYGKGAADIVYTKYTKLRFHQQSETADVVDTFSRYIYDQNDVNTVRPHIDLTLGLAWGSYFAQNHGHVTVSADYGFQVFFNQNMFRNFVDDQTLAKSISPNGNLYMQGLTATLRFDF